MPSKIILPFGLGARPDDPDGRDYKYTHAARACAAVGMPLKVDNRDLFAHIPIFDQGKEGVCVGMGIATVMSLHGTLRSPRWAYVEAQYKDEWEGEAYMGTSGRGGLEAARLVGDCSWEHWPFLPFITSGMLPDAPADAALHKLPRYERLETFQQVLDAIGNTGYCLATLNVHTGWVRLTKKHRIRYSPRYYKRGHHFIVAVGADEGTGYFVIRNSWGPEWGDNGHAYLKFDDWLENMSDAWLPVFEVNA